VLNQQLLNKERCMLRLLACGSSSAASQLHGKALATQSCVVELLVRCRAHLLDRFFPVARAAATLANT
jgi:hypothetical protein